MQPPESISEVKMLVALLGAMGAVFAMVAIKDLTPVQRLAIVLAGAVIAVLFTEPVVELVGIPKGLSYGVAFLIGTFGWSIIGSLLVSIRKADWWDLLREILRSWFVRKGG